jgi:hypothetical protein
MSQINLAILFLVMLALGEAQAKGLVNTEAGTFQCRGSVVRLDSQGIPFSGDPGGEMKPCHPIVAVGETV